MQTMLPNSKKHDIHTENETLLAHTTKLAIVSSSAGGVEAFSMFVGTVPVHFPAPILLAQHLDSDRSHYLRLILQEHTCLPVHEITTHTLLRAGEIYVVPPDYTVTFNDGCVEMQEQEAQAPKPSVDLLLSSAARTYGDRLIAVILAGSDSDGVEGAIEVKHAGGLVIVQKPDTARFPSLPSALPPTMVDFQVNLEDIGPLLLDLLAGATLPSDRQQDDVLRHILAHLQSQMQIDVRRYTTVTLLHHIGSRLLLTRTPTMRAYLNYLQATPSEIEELGKAVLDPVTHFFDDPDLFAYLKSTLLPELIARDRDRTLRCWTIGCETGEDPYSLAMLLSDLLGEELAKWQVKIFATDRDEEAISFARRGWYAESLLTGLPSEYSGRFFMHEENGYRVNRSLRQMVTFGKHEIGRDVPFPRLDLILCRNILSPFTTGVQEKVLNQLAFSLFPAGYLVLGKAEKVPLPQALYAPMSQDSNIYRCIGYALPGAQAPDRAQFRKTPLSPAPVVERTQPSEPNTPLPTFDPGQTRSLYELLLRALPIGLVVIDRAYQVLTANGIARRWLGMRTTPDEVDFFHIIPSLPSNTVRNALETAFREQETITLPEVELDVLAGGQVRFVSLAIAPIYLDTPLTELAVISLLDVTQQVQTRLYVESLQAEQVQLVNELGAANTRLREVQKARLDAQQALHSTNEELALRQQKLQEVEMNNEELRTRLEQLEATSEELKIMNEDLRATLEAGETSKPESEDSPGEAAS
jgi:two-component system CheB/CheR fusion protein